MAGVTFNWGFDLSSNDDEDQQEPAQEEGAAGGWQPGTQEEDPGGQEEDQGQEEPYTPTNARPRLVQRTISLTFGLGEATCESPRVSVSFHMRKFPRSAHKNNASYTPTFKYTSLSVWARRTVVSHNGRKLTLVSPAPPSPVLSGVGMWWDPFVIE